LNKSQIVSSTSKKLVYHHIRKKYGLSAQLAIQAITKTCETYKLNKKKQPKFKKYGAITYDDRILIFKGLSGKFPQVSLTTLDGRRVYEINILNYFAGRVNRIKGQTDLVYQNGKFYLYTTCDIPEDTPLETDNFLDVDLGELNIAMDSIGKIFSNDKVEKKYGLNTKNKETIAKKNTKSSKRKLKKVSGKERRFKTDTNHCVSKYLVEKAKDTNVNIALENLSEITKRTIIRKIQRAKRHSWSFYQLR
jgi:IS605 OrfB family transposase